MPPFERVVLGHGDEDEQTQSFTLPPAASVFATQPDRLRRTQVNQNPQHPILREEQAALRKNLSLITSSLFKPRIEIINS